MKKRVLIVLLCFVGALSSAFAAEKKVQGVVISSEDIWGIERSVFYWSVKMGGRL